MKRRSMSSIKTLSKIRLQFQIGKTKVPPSNVWTFAHISRVNWVRGEVPPSRPVAKDSVVENGSMPDQIPNGLQTRPSGKPMSGSKNYSNTNSQGQSKAFPLQARSRYREPLQNCRINSINFSRAVIEFEKPQETLTPLHNLW